MPDAPTAAQAVLAPPAPKLKIVRGSIGSMLAYVLPISAIHAVCFAPTLLYTMIIGPTEIERDDIVPLAVVWLLLASLGSVAADGAIVRGMLSRRELGNFAIGSSLKHAAAQFPTLLGLRLMSTTVTLLGFLLGIVPGFIAMTGFVLAVPCLMQDGVSGASEALRRSWTLTRGIRLRIFGGGLLLYFLHGWATEVILSSGRGGDQQLRFGATVAWFLLTSSLPALVSAEVYEFVRASTPRPAVSPVDAVLPAA